MFLFPGWARLFSPDCPITDALTVYVGIRGFGES